MGGGAMRCPSPLLRPYPVCLSATDRTGLASPRLRRRTHGLTAISLTLADNSPLTYTTTTVDFTLSRPLMPTAELMVALPGAFDGVDAYPQGNDGDVVGGATLLSGDVRWSPPADHVPVTDESILLKGNYSVVLVRRYAAPPRARERASARPPPYCTATTRADEGARSRYCAVSIALPPRRVRTASCALLPRPAPAASFVPPPLFAPPLRLAPRPQPSHRRRDWRPWLFEP
eukprot:4573602-Prymnesium_polylepis.2